MYCQHSHSDCVSRPPANSPLPGPPQASTLGKAEAITKTQARRPRYRMTGITTLTGRFSSAVGTTHDASKVIPCIVILLLAAKPPSPEVVHDKAPVPPGSVFLYDHIDPSWPMMFRIASCCQLPASRPAPGLHARKRGGRSKKDITLTGCLSEKLSMFFSNSTVN